MRKHDYKWSPKSQWEIRGQDNYIQEMVLAWIYKKFEDEENSRKNEKRLTKNGGEQ